MNDPDISNVDPFAHLRQQACQRANRTVDRLAAGVAALRAAGQKVTAESIKHITRDLEPGFAGLSFQVIRRNPRAYGLYREAADAFASPPTPKKTLRKKRRRRTAETKVRSPHSSYDPLQRLDKRDLVGRIRTLEQELDTELRRRGALAYDQQAVRARLLRLETEVVLLQARATP